MHAAEAIVRRLRLTERDLVILLFPERSTLLFLPKDKVNMEEIPS